MSVPHPVRLFHITAIANLPAICASGALLSKNAGAAAGIAYQNIAHQGAQGARAGRAVPNPPGGVVHDYVPFYFAPRSPMLYAVNGGRVEGCRWRQGDIVHLETTVDRVTAGSVPFVFYDRNATLAFSRAFTDLARLDEVAWDLLTEQPRLDGFCKYWQNNLRNERYADRMERRQAEFLVRERVSLGSFAQIGVMDEQQAQVVCTILGDSGVNLPVRVKRDWYFLGQ
ncbi:MAG: DUF4433 domain-containing protein [Acidihalobacter sp.]|jgi:hypothetical protein|uniref:type II toxin-antitoxin system toxin DNA ADP-ribosyl transferase DarT n=1 Tax=Acidihalobacter sp. TaxID=1872108 RepID=UPI00307D2C9C